MSDLWESNEYWELDHHLCRPVQPLYFSMLLESQITGSEAAFAAWSLPMARANFQLRRGWTFVRVEPFGGEPPPLAAKLPFLAHAWRLRPKLRRRILGLDRLVREGRFEQGIALWQTRWRPESQQRLATLRAVRLGALSDRELAAHLDALYSFLVWAWGVHLQCHVICLYVRGQFVDACHRLLDLDQSEALELLQRTDPELRATSDRVAAMASRAASDDVVLKALEQPAAAALAALRGTWFDAALTEFVAAEGDRPLDGGDLAEPTWREAPELVVALVQQQRASSRDPIREEAEFQAWRRQRIDGLRARLAGDALAEFDRLLALGEQAYPLSETHNVLLYEVPMGLIRYAALEAGRRLMAAGKLAEPADVFWLSRAELTDALIEPRDLCDLTARRRQEHDQNAQLQPPRALGRPSPPPPLHVFPPAAAAALRITLDQLPQVFGAEPPASAGGNRRLTGFSGAPGTVEGPARVVKHHAEFAKVQPGDVLVCPFTAPTWTVLFPLVAGLVTDNGGALSHAAIVAREYGVPAVVGTHQATQVLADGQWVRVDGSAGVVEVLEPAAGLVRSRRPGSGESGVRR